MRRILIDSARKRLAQRRGGRHQHVDIDQIDVADGVDDSRILRVNDALEKFAVDEPEKAEHLLPLLDQTNIKSTWCIILPGYDSAVTAKIKSAGHDLATHYDALGEGTSWSEQDWQRV